MDEWKPAKKIAGLFPDEAPPPTPRAAPAPPRPARRPASQPGFEASTAAFQRSREGTSRHVFDVALDLARSQFTGNFIDSTAKIFAVCGYYGLFGTMGVLLLFTILHAVLVQDMGVAGRMSSILIGLAGAAAFAVLQYTASRFTTSLDRLNKSTPSAISSTAILDCFALLSMIGGLTFLIWMAVLVIQTGVVTPILTGLVVFIVCEYLACVALNPESLAIKVESDARAGEEALGIVSFFLKSCLHLVPVAFGAGVVWGTATLVYACYLLFGDDVASAAGLATETTFWTLVYAGLPFLAYVLFLLLYLQIDLIRALLSIPGKLDKMSGQDGSEE
jgi:hypothetical protein